MLEREERKKLEQEKEERLQKEHEKQMQEEEEERRRKRQEREEREKREEEEYQKVYLNYVILILFIPISINTRLLACYNLLLFGGLDVFFSEKKKNPSSFEKPLRLMKKDSTKLMRRNHRIFCVNSKNMFARLKFVI